MGEENSVRELWPFGQELSEADRVYLSGIEFESVGGVPENAEDFPCLIIGKDNIFYAHERAHGANLSRNDLKGRGSDEITDGIRKLIAVDRGLVGAVHDVIPIYTENSSLEEYASSVFGQVEVNLIRGIGFSSLTNNVSNVNGSLSSRPLNKGPLVGSLAKENQVGYQDMGQDNSDELGLEFG